MRATNSSGDLVAIPNCYIDTPYGKIEMKVLPDISDSKSARYSDEPIIGRSQPLKTYSHSENRSISWTIHLVAMTDFDLGENARLMRLVESLLYPREGGGGAPFSPPPVCKIRCGNLLATEDLCVIMVDYSLKFPTDAPWLPLGGESASSPSAEDIFLFPSRVDIDTKWEVVYDSNDLPGQDRIMGSGR